MVKKIKISKSQYFTQRSEQIKKFFLETITDLRIVNDQIEEEIDSIDERVAILEVEKNYLTGVKEENEAMKEKLASFIS